MKRIPCSVPFCRRTFVDDGSTETICGKHWRMAPKVWRARRSRLLRMFRKRFGDNDYWNYPPGSAQRLQCLKLGKLIDRLWDRCKAAAIEAAGGI